MTPSSPRNFGPGFLCWWHSSLGSIPKGWTLCNGENGTPDLLDRVIWGAGIFPVDLSGGSVDHVHDFTSNSHTHEFGNLDDTRLIGAGYQSLTPPRSTVGTTDRISNLPPYHALLPIMEL